MNLHDVQLPEVVVAEGPPDLQRSGSLPVMHVALGEIIAKDTGNGDDLFPLGEPALGAEPHLGLCATGRHSEEGCDANEEGDTSLDKE